MLHEDCLALLDTTPEAAALLGLARADCTDFASLAGALMRGISGNSRLGQTVARLYNAHPALVALSTRDIEETARRNFEPGGAAATLLFARGAQAVMAHRLAHHLWQSGDRTLAMALKSVLGRALGTDIHPAARIGAGLWLDHGLGCVIGETAVIGEDVSIWHNVTLGSTLADSGPTRHPQIGRGAVIGAGASVLGNIRVGAGANIGAGAVVLDDVPENTVFAGPRAAGRGPARVRFAPDPS